MKTRQIIRNAQQVRAIFAGATQFRVATNPQPEREGPWWIIESKRPFQCTSLFAKTDPQANTMSRLKTNIVEDVRESLLSLSPYTIGDILWVRETWRPMCNGMDYGAQYMADGTFRSVPGIAREYGAEWHIVGPWRSSVQMPRWASRITLRVTDVLVERLQEINEEDCRAEGLRGGHDSIPGYEFSATPREHAKWLWDTLNAKRGYPWNSNPWVWAITFERVEKT